MEIYNLLAYIVHNIFITLMSFMISLSTLLIDAVHNGLF
jgi:hypothetical protein